LVSAPAAEWVAFGADHPLVNDPVALLLRGLAAVKACGLDVPQLRQVLRRWIEWLDAHPLS
jgi:hypothetical protein